MTTQPYRSILLMIRRPHLNRERHDLVARFLIALGVPTSVAESDAEGIEHHVSPETLAGFRNGTFGKSEPGLS